MWTWLSGAFERERTLLKRSWNRERQLIIMGTNFGRLGVGV